MRLAKTLDPDLVNGSCLLQERQTTTNINDYSLTCMLTTTANKRSGFMAGNVSLFVEASRMTRGSARGGGGDPAGDRSAGPLTLEVTVRTSPIRASWLYPFIPLLFFTDFYWPVVLPSCQCSVYLSAAPSSRSPPIVFCLASYVAISFLLRWQFDAVDVPAS